MIPATYDNATKLIHVQGHDFIGAVTYGLGVIGQGEPRTVHSFLPELDAEMGKKEGRLTVKNFAIGLGKFFMRQWKAVMPSEMPADAQIVFFVAGYDENEAYGETYQIRVPGAPTPRPLKTGKEFGINWGGQTEFIERIINGLDRGLVSEVQQFLGLKNKQMPKLYEHLRTKLSARIPYPFLPLQDCVDLTKLVIETTTALQSFVAGVRGVGGPVDMAVITRHNGYKPLQQKEIHA